MKHKFFLGVVVVLSSVFVSCNNSTNTQSLPLEQVPREAQEQQVEEKVAEETPAPAMGFSGRFEGTIPSSKGAVRYVVVFGTDGSCTLTRTSLKEGSEPETITGTFELNMKNMPRLICKFANEESISFIQETDDEILLEDEEGDYITHRERYLLGRMNEQ